MLYEEWKSRYKNLKNFNTVLQRCPRFWPLAPPRGMNPGVYSLGISEDPPRYLSSKFDASVRSDCWDISIWKTLTQCDGNGNANANANANVDDRGDYNSSPCTLYRRAKKTHKKQTNKELSPTNPTRVVILVDDAPSCPVLHFYQFLVSSKYCEGYSCYRADTKPNSNTSREDNSKNKKASIALLVSNTLSRPVLHFYQVKLKYSNG